MFRGSENQEQLSLEGKLGATLTLSWLVGGQFAAKRGKLTLLGRLRGVISSILEAPKWILEALGTLLGPLGGLLGSSWGYFADIWELFGSYVGACTAYFKRLIEILKNHQKQYKVSQKLPFGGAAIDEKMSLEGKLGLILTLSWLVRVQVGAKRGKLTLLGGLGGVILRILEAPKRILGPLGALLGPLGRVLGASWEPLGSILVVFWCVWEVFWRYFGAWEASLKRLAEILKNHEKPWRVLQKSMFGGS